MPFFRNRFKKCNCKHSKEILHNKQKVATSLQTYLLYPLVDAGKRVSCITSKWKSGSLSLEAAFAFPLVLFFLINLMSAITIIGFQSNLESAMYQTAKEMAMWGYAYQKADIILPEIALSEGYAKSKITQELGKKYIENAPIQGGTLGLTFLNSRIMEENIIDLRADYRTKAVVGILSFSEIPSISRCRIRAWTGYDNTDGSKNTDSGEQYVYITESGTVYHTSRNCTHLDLSVKPESYQEIENLRNQNGSKYYPCESCWKGMEENVVYVTEQGNRFHSYLGCSGLKRTIQEIPLSQATGMSACKRCGGKN